jgi:hypothetical protein
VDPNSHGAGSALRRTNSIRLLRLFAGLFAIPFPRQRFFHATLLTGLQIEGVALNFLDDVFLLDLPLEPAQRVFKGFALLNSNFRQKKYTSRHPCVGSFILLQREGLRERRLTRD